MMMNIMMSMMIIITSMIYLLYYQDSAASSHTQRLITWIPSTPEQETADAVRGLVLRYLNQALICFDGQESKCKFMMKSVNDQQQHGSKT